MPETTLTIRNYQALTIRLEPTDVRGKDLAGQPVLSLPLKLRLLPVGPPQTGEPYVLLRLAGTVWSNLIGEFARFEVGPLAEESNPSPYDRQCDVDVPLDRVQIKRFEDVRAGSNANLTIGFSALVWLRTQSIFAAVHANSQLQVVVPKSHWVEEVVSKWSLSNPKIVEIRFPKSETGGNFHTAYSRIEAAERAFANGQYSQVLVELYSAFEGLAKSHQFSKPDQSFFVSLLADMHDEKKEKAKLALDHLCGFLHLGRHEPKPSPETFQIFRSDARFALTMAHAVFEYITPKA